MILEARNISFRYGEKSREILKDFSLKAESTERVGLVAPSGFGKQPSVKYCRDMRSLTADRFCWTESLLISMAPTVRFS